MDRGWCFVEFDFVACGLTLEVMMMMGRGSLRSYYLFYW